MPCEIPKLDRDQPHIVASVRVTPANATSYVTYNEIAGNNTLYKLFSLHLRKTTTAGLQERT